MVDNDLFHIAIGVKESNGNQHFISGEKNPGYYLYF